MKKIIITITTLVLLLNMVSCSKNETEANLKVTDFEYVVSDETVTITKYVGSKGLVIIPSEIDGKKVTQIGKKAFEYTNVESVVIPDSVASIGNGAFLACSKLKNVEIPQSVELIGKRAFMSCDKLTSITFPEKLTVISDGMLACCASLKSIKIPLSVQTIEGRAFYYCSSLVEINIHKNIQSITAGAFANCKKLKAIIVDKDNPKYSDVDGVLYDKKGSTILSYPDGKPADTYEISNAVEKIGEFSFGFASNLEKIVVPESVKEIGGNAFADCKGLKGIYFQGDFPIINDNAFQLACEDLILYRKEKAAGWSDKVYSFPVEKY